MSRTEKLKLYRAERMNQIGWLDIIRPLAKIHPPDKPVGIVGGTLKTAKEMLKYHQARLVQIRQWYYSEKLV